MSDLISRQAAIELMCRALHYCYEEGYAVSQMMALPSAQPEPCEDAVRREDVQSIAEMSDWFESSDSFNDFMWALYDLPSAQPERWIPCDERLPERNQICIVTDETRRCTYEYGLHDETYDTENGWTYLGHKIIAWMPLPEPYAERRTDDC